MASNHFVSSISKEPVSEIEKTLSASSKHGADLRFLGVVRDSEDNREISGIEYSSYPGMAEKELAKIGESMGSDYGEHLALVHHCVGFVKAGEASILIRVQTKHSSAAYEISREYLRRIKETVPIWKKPILVVEDMS